MSEEEKNEAVPEVIANIKYVPMSEVDPELLRTDEDRANMARAEAKRQRKLERNRKLAEA